MSLPVRVRPIPSESFNGYLMRLASYNGYSTLREFASAADIPYRTHRGPSQLRVSEVSAGLSELLSISEDELARYFYPPRGTITSRLFLSVQSIFIKQPRLCIPCFLTDETRFFRCDWSLLTHSHCAKHGVELIDHCPECKSLLVLHSDIFEGCPSCQAEWTESNISKTPISRCQLVFERLRAKDQSAKTLSAWLKKFTADVLKCARPLDQYHDPIESLPSDLINIPLLLKQVCNLHSYRFQSGLEWPVEGFVKPRRLNYRESIRYHCKPDQMASMLGLNSRDGFSVLVESGVIRAVHESPITRDMLFDARDAPVLIERYRTTKAIPSDYVYLESDSRELSRHDCRLGDVIAASIKKNMLLLQSHATSFNRIAVHKMWLATFLSHHLAERCSGDISVNQAQRILECSPLTIKRLVSEQQLIEGRSSRIRGSSVIGLFLSSLPNSKLPFVR